MIYIYFFLAEIFCNGSILMSEVNSKTDTFRFNNMILNIEKSGAFEKNTNKEFNRPGYVVRGEERKFQIEFFTSMSNLEVSKVSPFKIKVLYNSKNRSANDTYLEISVKNLPIKNFKIFDFYELGKARLSSKLDIKI
ncbi:uncharacterized protein Eint_020200 [Encephalitozoon intestinalis ATCC 50506]|uniref:Uncharacterized protein n=1 Tax=Encephalitozoon intestinalis (strain ATCC 50506) TaxID=876142 RepID=E0S5N6_ENCIT|nr:uncharacterized protein Eint_020200 [Encephalitozoon intestinalis ATCC 50506]ADM11021.1 hypothetical protein Eint_020200 [Encephalitozoon intestinalis ATCC 50506]UTX44669.1 hypothetical protein GPK93_02g01840 [Encephalitozoon intestinalis]